MRSDKQTSDDLRAARLDDRLAKVARLTARELIDSGAACQKAKSFSVVTTAGAPLRSIYDVTAEKLEARLRRLVHGMAERESYTTVEAPLYIEFAGQTYVRLDHAINESGASAKDALEAAATLIQRYPAIRTTIADQAAADIRSLKKECTNG